MPDVLERLNLNVPKGVRKELREIAKREGRTEAEVAREMLIDAVEHARRAEWYRAVRDTYTPEMRARDLKVLRDLEKLRG